MHYDSAEDKAGMDSSADRINKIIAAEVEKKEIKPSQIVVAGITIISYLSYCMQPMMEIVRVKIYIYKYIQTYIQTYKTYIQTYIHTFIHIFSVHTYIHTY